MKVYTVYLNEDKGWTGDSTEGFYYEVLNACENEIDTFTIPIEDEFNKQINKLNIGESYIINIGQNEIKIICEDMSEEEYNSLDEFTGW